MQIWPGLVCILVIYLLFSLTFLSPCANWACCKTWIPKCSKAMVIKGEENGPGSFLVAILTEVQFSSVAQLCLNLCNSMDCSTTGLPVHHQLPELAQTHAHWVGDAIQPSHPLSSPSPPAFNLSQHKGLFQWVSSSHQVTQVLAFQLQHQSFQWLFRTDSL